MQVAKEEKRREEACRRERIMDRKKRQFYKKFNVEPDAQVGVVFSVVLRSKSPLIVL